MTRTRNRGLTLIELLISLVIMSIVMTAIVTVFIAVQKSYETISRSKTAIEGSRAATAYLERTVRLAGYGIDPRYAFDFTVGGAFVKDNGAVGTFGGVPVVTDDLAYRYRDPNWLRRGGVTGGNLVLDSASPLGGTLGVNFNAQQRFIVMCAGGTDWAVFELTGAKVAADTGGAVSPVVNPFPASSANCLKTTSGVSAAYVAILQERRVRIRDIGGRPFLVAYRRIRALDGTMDQPSATNLNYDPIAADVEDFQVAYVMNRPGDMTAGTGAFRSPCCAGNPVIDAAGNSNAILLDDPLETGTAGAPDPAATAPLFETVYDHADRYNKHPANIRQVRANLVIRSQRPNKDQATYSAPISLENYARTASPLDGFVRLPMTTTIRVPNMLTRSAFTPDLRTAAGEGNFNGG